MSGEGNECEGDECPNIDPAAQGVDWHTGGGGSGSGTGGGWGQTLSSNMFRRAAAPSPCRSGAVTHRLMRVVSWLSSGVLSGASTMYDGEHLMRCVRQNVGDWTFQDAYDRTGRILNITATPCDRNFNDSLTINYLTAPNVLLWSRLLYLASCHISHHLTRQSDNH